MIVTIGGRSLSWSSGSSAGASGSVMTSSTLWKPFSLSRFSRSKVKPWISQIFAAVSGSIGWLGAGKTPSLIRSAMMLNGFRPRREASSGTRIGGLMMISFGSPESSGSLDSASAVVLTSGADSTAGAGILTIDGSSFSRTLEMDPITAFCLAVVLRTLGLASSAKRSRALSLA